MLLIEVVKKNPLDQGCWQCEYVQSVKKIHYILVLFVFFAGDITQKGYEKKRAKLLAPYIIHIHTPGKPPHTHLISLLFSSLVIHKYVFSFMILFELIFSVVLF